MKRRRVLTWAACVLAAAWVAGACAQEYPSRPIRWIVPFTPGSMSDIVCRALQPELSSLLGQQVVIENLPGAASVIGTAKGAKAAPDGYTLTYAGSAAFGINPSLMKLPFDPVKDFAPVSMIGTAPYVLAVPRSFEANSLRELIALAKARPGGLSYGSPGNGTGSHLSMESFKAAAGINVVHVPYKGSTPLVTDLIGGHVQLAFEPIASVGPHIKAGKLKALAVANASRLAGLPDTPTVAQAGLPQFEPVFAWFGAVVPAGTPPAVVERLNRAFVAALGTVRAPLSERYGIVVTPGTPEEFGAFIRAEIPKFRRILELSGAKLD